MTRTPTLDWTDRVLEVDVGP
ncbi:MAG: hypothetical protein QOG20_4222, partial [Pseudonocardiales bacterium]|nr:hypothetical protein [Pseudonocardiales bacterium]